MGPPSGERGSSRNCQCRNQVAFEIDDRIDHKRSGGSLDRHSNQQGLLLLRNFAIVVLSESRVQRFADTIEHLIPCSSCGRPSLRLRSETAQHRDQQTHSAPPTRARARDQAQAVAFAYLRRVGGRTSWSSDALSGRRSGHHFFRSCSTVRASRHGAHRLARRHDHPRRVSLVRLRRPLLSHLSLCARSQAHSVLDREHVFYFWIHDSANSLPLLLPAGICLPVFCVDGNASSLRLLPKTCTHSG